MLDHGFDFSVFLFSEFLVQIGHQTQTVQLFVHLQHCRRIAVVHLLFDVGGIQTTSHHQLTPAASGLELFNQR